MLRGIKQMLGSVPPHFELFATVNPERFKLFMSEIAYLSKHVSITPDFFAFLRFYISTQNKFTYCYNFNKQLLLSKGYSEEILENLEKSVEALPLDERHQTLFKEALMAIDTPDNFDKRNIEKLSAQGWSDADIFDAIDHAAFLFKFSKILRAYSK